MALIGVALGAALAALAAVARILLLLRDRARHRRAVAWHRWWVGYCRRLPGIMMARWPRNRSIAYRPDPAS